MKILNIVESAYRGTVEEQDDTILWLSQSMRVAGADLDILLRGNAVNYALTDQNAPLLRIGNWCQRHAADVGGQIAQLAGSKAIVYASMADLLDRGILKERVSKNVKLLSRAEITNVFEQYDRILAW